MKLPAVREDMFKRFGVWFATGIRVALCFLLALLGCALVVGIVKSGIDLAHSLRQPLDVILQNVLLDAVFILALTEISITVVGYLQEGRVHVRYIVDTVLIIMLNEIVGLWFKHPSLADAIGIAVIVGILAVIRLSVTVLAPRMKA